MPNSNIESLSERALELKERKFNHQVEMDKFYNDQSSLREAKDLEERKFQHQVRLDEAILVMNKARFEREVEQSKEAPRRFTRLTIESSDGSCSVEVNKEDMGISEFVEELIRPVLLGMGCYPSETIDNFFSI